MIDNWYWIYKGFNSSEKAFENGIPQNPKDFPQSPGLRISRNLIESSGIRRNLHKYPEVSQEIMGQFLELLLNKPQGPWLYGVSRSARYGNVNNHDEDVENGDDIGKNDDNAEPGNL